MAKAKKTRAKKYDDKLAIDGTFEDVIKASLSKLNMEKQQPQNGLTAKQQSFSDQLKQLEIKYSVELEGMGKISDHFTSYNENDTLFHLKWIAHSKLPSDVRAEVKNIAVNIWGPSATFK